MTALAKNGPLATCALQPVDFTDLKLPYQFLVDLAEAVRLTGQSMADDLLRGAIWRESLARAIKAPAGRWLSSTKSFAVIWALLKSPPERVRLARRGTEVPFTTEMRERVLALLCEYGVSCARGECCGGVE